MTIEEAEVIFEKRWNSWTEKEWDEFLDCIIPEQLRLPGILKQVATRIAQDRGSCLPVEIQDKMREYMTT